MFGIKRGIEGYFDVQQFSFYITGIVVSNKGIRFVLFGFLNLFLTFSLVYLTICIFIFCIQYMDEFDLITVNIAVNLQFVLGLWKLAVFLIKRNDLINIIKSLDGLIENATDNELKIIKEENQRDVILSKTYLKSVTCTCVGLSFAPFIPCVILLVRSGDLCTMNLQMKATYFIDTEQPLNFIIIFMVNIAAIFMDGILSVAIDTLYSWIIHNLSAQFRVIQLNFEELNERIRSIAATSVLQLNSNLHVQNHFYKCIKKHQNILNLTDTFQRAYSLILFGQFALNSLQLCFIAVQIMRWSNVAYIPFLISFLFGISFQLTIYCYGGQRIQDESGCVASTVYNNLNWELYSITQKNIVLFTLMRSQRQHQLLGVFFVVNYPLFLWVVRTSSSFITLVWSFSD